MRKYFYKEFDAPKELYQELLPLFEAGRNFEPDESGNTFTMLMDVQASSGLCRAMVISQEHFRAIHKYIESLRD